MQIQYRCRDSRNQEQDSNHANKTRIHKPPFGDKIGTLLFKDSPLTHGPYSEKSSIVLQSSVVISLVSAISFFSVEGQALATGLWD